VRVERLALPPLPPGRPNLVLAGFMGVGKTTVGRYAADLLGIPFFDLDEEVEISWGGSISALFRAEGEEGFRRREAEMLKAATRLSGAVVAVGGGAVLHRELFAQLGENSVLIPLDCSPTELSRRLDRARADRPLLRGSDDGWVALRSERETLYRALGEGIDTTDRTPQQVAEEVVGRYQSAVASSASLLRGGGSEILVRPGAVRELGSLLSRVLPQAERAIVIAQRGLEEQRRSVVEVLRNEGLKIRAMSVPGGEAGKTVRGLATLWRRLLGLEVDRGDVLVAVGGGALLDLVGFAAATYARGVPLVNVPTTVLAMADAAVGGKVAVDFAGSKNAVGCFFPARAVVCDPDLLGEKSPAVQVHGVAEIVKCAVLGSPFSLALLNRPGAAGSGGELAFLIEQALRIKLAYVTADPEDHGPRLALNLGHTYAHALEAASDYRLAHGPAVAIGLVSAARLGAELGLTHPELPAVLTTALEVAGLPVAAPPDVARARVADSWRSDKKRRAGRDRVVVPAEVGNGAQIVQGLDPEVAMSPLWIGGRDLGLLP
jgi:shikimate kinase/3-dehydroquinate synthase